MSRTGVLKKTKYLSFDNGLCDVKSLLAYRIDINMQTPKSVRMMRVVIVLITVIIFILESSDALNCLYINAKGAFQLVYTRIIEELKNP